MSRRNLANLDRTVGQMIGRPLQEAFAHGIENDMIYGGLESGQSSLQSLHAEALVQNCIIGTRRVRWDGRVYRYGKASNIVSVRHFGLKFWGQIGDGVATTLAASQVVGDDTITITASGVSANEFKGGMVTMFSTPVQTRGILSNTATSGGTIVITLDEPLDTVVTSGGTYTEVLHNPYLNLRLTAGPSGGDSGNDYSSVGGIPCAITTVANYHLWVQTWGWVWVNPHGSSLQDAGITGGERKVVFDCEGSITIPADVAHGPCGAGGGYQQPAGFIVDRSGAGSSGPPLIMLQICQ
jgi:hypothetical protein